MSRTAAIILTLLFITAGFLLLGAWAARRTHNAADFVIANRRLGVWSTALGFSVGVVNALTTFLLAATAFAVGAAALWFAAGLLLGSLFNLFYVAPRLRIASAGLNATTLTQIVAADAGDRLQPAILRSAVFITICMLVLQAVVILRALADAAVIHFQFEPGAVMLTAIALVTACLLPGGLRNVCANHIAQAIAMLVLGAALLIAAAIAHEGETPWRTVVAALGATWGDPFSGKQGVVAGAYAAGALALGLAVCGQPPALNALMAARDEVTLLRARWAALVWLFAQLAIVLACGWAAGVLYAGLERPEYALLALGERPLAPWLGAVLGLALLACVLSSLSAPLLSVASALAVDLRRPGAALSGAGLRFGVLGASGAAVALATMADSTVVEHWWFAFTTLGAVLGPLAVVRVTGKRVRPGSMLGAMWSAFALSVIFHLLPDSPGDFLERWLPFVSALGIALTGGERRRNPDRADRAEETVHDRIPI